MGVMAALEEEERQTTQSIFLLECVKSCRVRGVPRSPPLGFYPSGPLPCGGGAKRESSEVRVGQQHPPSRARSRMRSDENKKGQLGLLSCHTHVPSCTLS